MNFLTIRLPIEKDESKDEALLNFHNNISELFDNEIDYAPKGIQDTDSNQVFVGLELNDHDLKQLLDAVPGNTFEIIDAQWPQFFKDKSEEGAQTFEINEMME